MDMEQHYYYGQETIKKIQELMKEIEEHALCRLNENHKVKIDGINRDLAELYDLLEF